ncbi:hypothetical protein BAAM0499_06140 [Bifidobacterium animalis subsp. animalis MCC 0499]|uniref:hypothetical protein n=1 Tax=Bifidobacterium animalis TaxID=28025 RepID=UPI00069AC65A|nr:hypothetical protein [Bifidobacterium animalis]KOA61194.1 hypothetical protein BAAM0499_06140 [Bifidobacterium animalis subsp. animalis MCC 0499]
MTLETNDTTGEKDKDVNSPSDFIGKQGMKMAAYYLGVAVQRLHDELRLRPMRVETSIGDDDGTSAIARINVKPQDKSGGLTVSAELESLSDGELFLAAGAAFALYAQAIDALNKNGWEV